MRTIRLATKEDIEDIYNMYRDLKIDLERVEDKRYKEQLQKDGFIVVQERVKDFSEHLKQAKAFYVFLIENTYGGFVIINDDFAKTDHNRIWYDDSMKKELYSPKTLLLYALGVHPAFMHNGVGTELLEAAEKHSKKAGYTHLVSIVPVGPYINEASLKFHQENGFTKVAGSKEAIKFEEIDGYEYLIFAKKLK